MGNVKIERHLIAVKHGTAPGWHDSTKETLQGLSLGNLISFKLELKETLKLVNKIINQKVK